MKTKEVPMELDWSLEPDNRGKDRRVVGRWAVYYI